MTEMNASYFIKKFEAIPDNLWTIGDFEYAGRKCALGHCGTTAQMSFHTPEAEKLNRMFLRIGLTATVVNDGCCSKYPQITPKARILAALTDLITEGLST